MDMLLSFLFWAATTFLVFRLGSTPRLIVRGRLRLPASAGLSKSDGAQLRWVPPAKDVDPVCGETVTTDKAKPSLYAGNVYYFCSRECREVFEAAPHFYAGSGDPDQPKLEHSHG
ncbi:MAG: YHS domain-containing protein [Rhodospirillales bacterium]|nr:YHS domain-containing protein [Rhodospirillales bacterium]